MTDGIAKKRALLYLRVSSDRQTRTAGDGKGYSIHAQGEICRRKAAELEAEVVDEYVDLAQSAKSADRPELQRMLKRIHTKQDVDYLVVYKVDRFARNLSEDREMLAELASNGVRLISATEHIDETPEGRMMHAIFATLAEYEVAKLAVRVATGMNQKAQMGGTPWRAPLGYLNVPAVAADGYEYRTIAIDEERAPHIQWAFRSYGTGRYSLNEIVDMLDGRGFRTKPRKRGGQPVSISKAALGRTLRDPYYTGKMRYKGQIIDHGKHEPLISQALFDRVQEILTEKNTSGTRRRVHRHPLKGMLRCGHCSTQMYYSLIRNRHGSEYQYFRCKGSQDRRCTLGYVGFDPIVERVERIHRAESKITEEQLEVLNHWVRQAISEMSADNEQAQKQADRDLERLSNQRRKLLELHFEEIIDKETFRSEQDRIDVEERQARLRLTEASSGLDDVAATIEAATRLLQTWPERMHSASPKLQDEFHQVFYTHFTVSEQDEDEVIGVQAERTEANERLRETLDAVKETLVGSNNEPALAFAAAGSNMSQVVRHEGLEPPTPCASWTRRVCVYVRGRSQTRKQANLGHRVSEGIRWSPPVLAPPVRTKSRSASRG